MSEPIYKRVQRLADQLRPEHVAEMAAIKWFAMVPATRRPIMRGCSDASDASTDLLRRKLLTATIVPKWSRRTHRLLNLTQLGERVFLHVSERALLATGAIVWPIPAEYK